jgi:RNA ligase
MEKVLTILVGAQGSGKTTYCAQNLPGYFRVSQDDMGKAGYREALEAAVARGEPFIVVDRINHLRSQRGDFISMGRRNGYITKIIWLNVDRTLCVKRVMERKDHPTLPAKQDIVNKAVAMFFRTLQMPSKSEADELVVIGGRPPFAGVVDLREKIGSRRHVIIGDPHGCHDEVQDLLAQLNFNRDEDVLVSVGDLIDRGPKTRETVEFVMSLPRFFSVKGNHECKGMRFFSEQNKQMRLTDDLRATIESFGGKMPDDVVAFLDGLPLVLQTPSGFVVHAGFNPERLPDEQLHADCIYMRYFGGASYFDSCKGTLWYKLWPKDFPRVFFGHNPEDDPQTPENAVHLDGGCVFGGVLRAFDSADGKVHSVKARQKYAESKFQAAMAASKADEVTKREEYAVAGLIRTQRNEDGKLAVYTYTDQCTFERAWDDVTRNSRGHVFNIETGECVARAMPKFFNLNENEEALFEKFDWSQPYEIYDKLDGWFAAVFRYNGRYRISSRGSFESDGAKWATEFIQTKDLSFLPDEVTLCFEIINPKQKIILDYGGQSTLYVLCAFNRHTGEEYQRKTVEEWAAKVGLPIVKMYESSMTIHDCLRFQKEAKGMEGFVIRFHDGRRVKVKTDWYMTLAKIMSSLSPIAIWEAMENGKVKREFLTGLAEELRPLAEGYVSILEDQYAKTMRLVYDLCQPLVDKHVGKGVEGRKTLAVERETLRGTIGHRLVFAVLDKNEKAIDKNVMEAIYPSGNNFVAI